LNQNGNLLLGEDEFVEIPSTNYSKWWPPKKDWPIQNTLHQVTLASGPSNVRFSR